MQSSNITTGSIEQHHRVFIEMAPLTKIDRPELWGMSETPTEGGLFRVVDVSKVPWHVLCKQRDRQAVNDLRRAYRYLGVDAGEYVRGTGHTVST